jgi:hypothetical protein
MRDAQKALSALLRLPHCVIVIGINRQINDLGGGTDEESLCLPVWRCVLWP